MDAVEYDTTWNNAHKKHPSKYKKLKGKPGRTRTEDQYGTHKYINTTNNTQFYGISATKNSTNAMHAILYILKDCPYIIRQHEEININNSNIHTLFIPDAGTMDLQTKFRQLREKKLSDKDVYFDDMINKIVLQIVKAVACIHSKKIKHLDLKCENIVVNETDDIVLIDWETAQIGDNPCIFRGGFTMYCTELNMVKKIKNQQLHTFNGYYHDIHCLTCIFFIIIMLNLVSSPYITRYIKITKYILSEIGIDINTWLAMRCCIHYSSDPTESITDILKVVDMIMQSSNLQINKVHRYYQQRFNTIPDYDSKTDMDISDIIQILQPSLELSKIDVNSNRKQSNNSSGVVSFKGKIGPNGYLLSNNTPGAAAQPAANQLGGTRLHKKRKTYKRHRHQRNALTHYKKRTNYVKV